MIGNRPAIMSVLGSRIACRVSLRMIAAKRENLMARLPLRSLRRER